MQTYRLIVVLALAGVAACRGEKREPPKADPATSRQTTAGEVVGFKGSYGSDSWFGIPYAKPPVGDLRWHAPEPPSSWSDARPALTHGSSCVQYAGNMEGGPDSKPGEPAGSEDCLYLSVWTPRFADGKVPTGAARLPVMVWIHGGGNSVGEGGFYDGGNLAASENLVVVTINYRLGPFGWFRHPALRSNGVSAVDASGNFGTLDIVRSLEWVRDNAAAFGGDPNRVTVFGESAGGTNTFTMLLSPKARGLFHRAVPQSGGFFFAEVDEAENYTDDTPAGDDNSSSEVVLRALIRDGKASDRAGAKRVAEEMGHGGIAAYLRSKSSYDFLSLYEPEGGFGMIRLPMVFSDGEVLPSQDPLQVFATAGGYNDVPVVMGTNRDENKLFMFGEDRWVQRYLWIIPRLKDPRMYNLMAEYQAKMWKATGADQPAAAMRRNNEAVYVYRFDWDEEPTRLGADLSVMLGAAHAFEIPFVFGHFDLGPQSSVLYTEDNEPGRKQLSAAMMSYWAELAYNGAPGSGRKKDLPAWKQAPEFMVLDTAEGGGLRMSSDTLTSEEVVAAVLTDPRLAENKDRCSVLHQLAQWSRGFDEERYKATSACRDFPFDAYPWS